LTTHSYDVRLGVLLSMLTAMSGLSFGVAFRLSGLVIALVVTAAASVALTWIALGPSDSEPDDRSAVTLGEPPTVTRLFWWVVWLLVFVVIAMVCARDLHPSVVVDGIVNGWANLLSSAVPVDPDGSVVVVPLLLSWLAGTLAVLAARRTNAVTLPVIPSLLVLTVSLSFAVADPSQRLSPVLLVALIGAMLLTVRLRSIGPVLWGREHRGTLPAHRISRTLVLGSLTVSVATLGVLLAPRMVSVDQRNPVLLRDHYDPEWRDRPGLNPLATLTATERDEARAEIDKRPPSVAFTAEASGPVDRYRLATMDRYDGDKWTSSARFLAAGSELQPALALTVPTRVVHQKLNIGSLRGYWIPVADWPIAVSGPDLLTDPSSGMLTTRSSSSSGVNVEIDTASPIYDADRLLRADLPVAQVAAPYLTVPASTPESLYALVRSITGNEELPVKRASRIQDHLRKKLKALPMNQAQPGHSLAKLTKMLTDPAHAQGSPEQFATAFALMARLDGLPSRVVVGYRGPYPAGESTVTQRELTAWPEILFEGIGWVPFDPVPETRGQAPEDPAAAAATDVASASDIVEEATSDSETVGQTEEDLPSRDGDETEQAESFPEQILRYAALAAAVAVTALVILFAVTAWAKRRRRARRVGAASIRDRIVGAWHEAVDRLVERGVTVPESMSATDVARRGTEALNEAPGSSLVPLARLNNQALYAEEEPSTEQAAQAWALAATITARCRSTRSTRQHARAVLDPRVRVRRTSGVADSTRG